MSEEFPILGLENFHTSEAAEICLLNHVTHGNNKIKTAHSHDFYLFFLVAHSSGTHTIDFVNHPVTDHQIHILLPGQVHQWELQENTKGYQLMIGKKLFQTFSNHLSFSPILYFKHPVITLNTESFEQLNYEFKQFEQETTQAKPQWDIVLLRSKLIALFIEREMEKSFKDLSALKNNPIVARYINLIDEYYKQEKSVSFYADLLNITPNYLNILCQKYARLSANTIIQNRQILEIKRLLHISEMTIKQIAYELGFNDQAYFSNFFKRKMGVSPKEFRDKL
ncbi:helix-turn-helix domain-containing protein [Pedobacter frigoris]|uniref:Helix-turn-helix domain-containing protein n=1 Tax=Pedobacter frigoris TaxID=2571272 RepID=A0A4U1CNA2_9SPHI|nr:AraC family transcriptional regulator [Pedobacter frigoris]TKC09407.1 helix-turn-helix domain-containing protein [Pedobacter frigoris]